MRDPNAKPPNDLMQVFCDTTDAQGNRDCPEMICKKLLMTALGAVSTTIHHCTHFVYEIAARPELRQQILKEQQQMIAQHGPAFTKETMRDMVYLDACLHESLRLNVSAIGTFRKALCNVEFSNGMCIPDGRICFVNTHEVNCQETVYENTASEFMPERWMDNPSIRSYSTSSTFSTFGYGKHACPGRVFATSQLKVMMAWLIRNYDFTTLSGRRPDNIYYALEYTPIPEPIHFTLRDTQH
jgi:cytochrome P450